MKPGAFLRVAKPLVEWLNRHRQELPPELVAKAEKAILVLTHTKPRELENNPVGQKIAARDLMAFVDAWDAHRAQA